MEIEVTWNWLLWESGLVGDETFICVLDASGETVGKGHREDSDVTTCNLCTIAYFGFDLVHDVLKIIV